MSVIENIKKAGKGSKLLRIVYKKSDGSITDRVIEPYEIRKADLFGYDIDKEEIRRFKIVNILSSEILDDKYIPRWEIKV